MYGLADMPLLSTRNDPKRAPQLTRDDWIEAALSALTEDSIDAVQITQLAKRLGVTRGSFYWHFASREALLEALLAEWRARNSKVMLSALADAPGLAAGILELFAVWVDHKRFDPKLDLAVRDWARRAPEVHALLEAEDDGRVHAIARFFARHGYPETEAFIRARVIYFTQLSYYALGIVETPDRRMSYLAAYYRCFTGQDIDDGLAEAFRQRVLERETLP